MRITHDQYTDRFMFEDVTPRQAALMEIALGDATYTYDQAADNHKANGDTWSESIDRNFARILNETSKTIGREVERRRINVRARQLREARNSAGSR